MTRMWATALFLMGRRASLESSISFRSYVVHFTRFNKTDEPPLYFITLVSREQKNVENPWSRGRSTKIGQVDRVIVYHVHGTEIKPLLLWIKKLVDFKSKFLVKCSNFS